MTSWLIPLLVYLGYALFPLYFLPSGLPQISDVILSIFIFLSLFFFLAKSIKIKALPIEWSLLLLTVILVQLSWSIKLQAWSLFQHVFFWLFNYLVAFCLYNFIVNDQKKYLSILYRAISTALIISTAGVFLYLFNEGRVTGFFNNPNQLAYFSLISLVILSFLKDFKLNNAFHIFILALSILSILLSASIGATASLLLVVTSYLLKSINLKRFIQIFIATIAMVALIITIGGSRLTENVNNRLARVDTKVANIQDERSYDRILIHADLILLGAGEGEYSRFDGNRPNEIHSSFGNLLFSYGLLSFLLFSSLLIKILIRLPRAYSISFLATMSYSVTHMGLRSVYFWLLITICLYFSQAKATVIPPQIGSDSG